MNEKQLLDYLVSIGLGTKKVTSVKTKQPSFPNQDSIYVPKNTTFHVKQIEYTIGIPVVESDNTRVDLELPYSGETVSKPTMKDKLIIFLTKIFGDPYTQNFGMTLYSPTFGNKDYDPGPYRCKHWGGYINIDFLLPLMAAFGGIGEGLDMAWFLNYLKDIIGATEGKSAMRTGQNQALKETQKKLNEAIDKLKEGKGKKKSENDSQKEKIIEKYNPDSNVNTNSSTDQDPVFLRNDSIVDKVEFSYSIVEGEPYLRGSQVIKGEMVEYYSMPGDTISSHKKTTYKSGRVKYEREDVYPSTHIQKDGLSTTVQDIFRNRKRK